MVMPTILDIENQIEAWAPKRLAEEWDNIGLQIGNPTKHISKILVALDPTLDLLEKAKEMEAELVITHHPLIFKPLFNLNSSFFIPSLVTKFILSDIALIAAHTNLDAAPNGVSDQLAIPLKLFKTRPLLAREQDSDQTGIGRVGSLKKPVKLSTILDSYKKYLATDFLSVTGHPDMVISKVAICGGSGSDLWPEVLGSGADLYISAEIKHNVLREAEQLGKAIINLTHFQSEWPIVPAIVDYLTKISKEKKWDLEIKIFQEETAPVNIWGLEIIK